MIDEKAENPEMSSVHWYVIGVLYVINFFAFLSSLSFRFSLPESFYRNM